MGSSMKYSDMHTHGFYSDGNGRPFEFAEKAVEMDIISLGFSDHSPVPIDNSWSMKKQALTSYIKETGEVKKEYSKKIDIYMGMELDYIPDVDVKKHLNFNELPLDYFIGSVHYIYSKKLNKYLEVDGGAEDFNYLVKEGFNGDAEAVYKAYYNNVREMISEYIPVVMAHFNLVEKNNSGGVHFDVSDEDYLSEVENTLDIVKLYGTIVEINTGGMSRKYMDKPYPSEYILKRCLAKTIPVTINSDAHNPGSLAYKFSDTIDDVKKIGFKELIVYRKGNWTVVRL